MDKAVVAVLVLTMAFSIIHGQMDFCNNGCGCNQIQNNPGCGCGCCFSQNQNSYEGLRNTFGQAVSPACQSPLPCYDIVISAISDGPVRNEAINNEQEFLEAPSHAGLMRREMIAEGRKAAVFFRDTFGIDFTSIPDTAFLTGRQMNSEGLEFRPFRLDPVLRYRMYMASTNGEAQLFNRPILEQGWMLNFTRLMLGRGSFTKLIPADSYALYGHTFIHPCGIQPMDEFPQPCKNILNPQDPWAPIVLTYRSPTYEKIVLEPYPHLPVDRIFEHPTWGEGRVRSMVTVRDSEDFIFDARMTLTFPSYK